MKLTVKERIAMQGVLPVQGDYVTLSLARVFKDKLTFTEAEITALELQALPNGGLQWISDAPDYNIVVGPKTGDMVRMRLKEMEKQKTLPADLLDLYGEMCGKLEITDE
jgi:hypothetical protein